MRFQLYVALALFAFSSTTSAQFSFTGGPTDTDRACQALWAQGDTAFMAFGEDLYRTFNGGDDWTLMDQGLAANLDTRTIEVSDGVVIIGTNDGSRVYRSNDWGDNWAPSANGVGFLVPTASTSGPGLNMIGGTLVAPSIYNPDDEMWTATPAAGTLTHAISRIGQDSIWQCAGWVTWGETQFSHDNGSTWETVESEPIIDIGGGIMMAGIPQDIVKTGDRIIIGSNLVGFPIIYTDDYGANWTAGDLESTSYSDYGKRFVKVNDNHLLTSNLSGIWKSTDQGETWALIQPLALIRTMVLFKDNSLLVGTENGVCEFSNYGEGELVTKHGVTSSSGSLVTTPEGNLLTVASGNLHAYNPALNTWELPAYTVEEGYTLNMQDLAIMGDSILATSNSFPFTAALSTMHFVPRSLATFSGQDVTTGAEFGSLKLLGTEHPQSGSDNSCIFFSNDDGVNYTEATFTNTPSWNLGSSGPNFVEAFHEAGSTLVADMNAGFATSTDGGANWTFHGTTWDRSWVSTVGNTINVCYVSGIWGESRTLMTSVDGGETWTDIPTNGIPGGDTAGFMGFFGSFTTNDQLTTLHSNGANSELYAFDASNQTWSVVPGTEGPVQESLNYLLEIGGALYGSWTNYGIWANGEVSNGMAESFQQSLRPFPNPASDHISLGAPASEISNIHLFDILGQEHQLPAHTGPVSTLRLPDVPTGIYILTWTRNGQQQRTQIQILD